MIRWLIAIAIGCAVIGLIVNSAGCTSYETVRLEIIAKEPPTTLIADVDGEKTQFEVPRWYYELHPIGWVNYYAVREGIDYTKE